MTTKTLFETTISYSEVLEWELHDETIGDALRHEARARWFQQNALSALYWTQQWLGFVRVDPTGYFVWLEPEMEEDNK